MNRTTQALVTASGIWVGLTACTSTETSNGAESDGDASENGDLGSGGESPSGDGDTSGGGMGGGPTSSQPSCENSSAAALLDFIRVEGEVEPYLQTDSSKRNTAEVYCVFREKPDKLPILMLPGLGLSHYMFLSTPDRREGFASHFADAGHPVYVMNPSANGASAMDTEATMALQRWEPDRFWDRWGFGPSEGVPYEDVRFPIEDFSDFVDHMPLWGGGNDAEEELVQLLEAIGPAILMFHSAGGEAGFSVSLRRPELVTHLVVLEPVGCPAQGEPFAEIPFLAVYGDYVQPRGQASRLTACTETAAMVAQAGLPGEVISYPDRGIFGNTHLYAQDDNNDVIAGDIIDWLQQ